MPWSSRVIPHTLSLRLGPISYAPRFISTMPYGAGSAHDTPPTPVTSPELRVPGAQAAIMTATIIKLNRLFLIIYSIRILLCFVLFLSDKSSFML